MTFTRDVRFGRPPDVPPRASSTDPPIDEPGKPPPAEIEYPPPHHPPSSDEPVTPILPAPEQDPDSPGAALVRGDDDIPEPNEPG